MATKNLSRSIVECGRGKHAKFERNQIARGFRKWKQDEEGELLPEKAKGDRRELRDKLSPLYRWIKAHVGQPWNQVFSKFSQINDSRSLMVDHILSHLQQEVWGSGGREYCLFPSAYQPLCRIRGLHGYSGYFVGETGLLEHHTDKDCWAWSAERGYFPPKRESVKPSVWSTPPKSEKSKRDPLEVLKERKLARNRGCP